MSVGFEKNKSLDQFLGELNQALIPSERVLEDQYADKGQRLPTVLKVGLPRVGGTLLTQWASSSGAFYLPSNFLSRFYGAPCAGALITELLRNPAYDYKDEFSDVNRETGFSSDIGKTSGLLAPHEFWYFWRDKLHLPDVPVSNDEFLERSDFSAFNKSLNALKGVVGKPVFLKGHLVNFHLKTLAESNENFVYFHLKRNLLDVAQSLYFARIKWQGSEKKWFSHKPREYSEISGLDPIHQVVGQVYFIEKSVLDARSYFGDRYVGIEYKELCERPDTVYNSVINCVSSFSEDVVKFPKYTGSKSFSFSSNPDKDIYPKMRKALDYFFGRYGEL